MTAVFWECEDSAMIDDFFRNRLDQMIDWRQPLAVLASRPLQQIEARGWPRPSAVKAAPVWPCPIWTCLVNRCSVWR